MGMMRCFRNGRWFKLRIGLMWYPRLSRQRLIFENAGVVTSTSEIAVCNTFGLVGDDFVTHVILVGRGILLFDLPGFFLFFLGQGVDHLLDVFWIRQHFKTSETRVRKHVILLNHFPFENSFVNLPSTEWLPLSRLFGNWVVNGVSSNCLVAAVVSDAAIWIIPFPRKKGIAEKCWRIVRGSLMVFFLLICLTLVAGPIRASHFDSRILRASISTHKSWVQHLLGPIWRFALFHGGSSIRRLRLLFLLSRSFYFFILLIFVSFHLLSNHRWRSYFHTIYVIAVVPLLNDRRTPLVLILYGFRVLQKYENVSVQLFKLSVERSSIGVLFILNFISHVDLIFITIFTVAN